jgi:hypothetical protein
MDVKLNYFFLLNDTLRSNVLAKIDMLKQISNYYIAISRYRLNQFSLNGHNLECQTQFLYDQIKELALNISIFNHQK